MGSKLQDYVICLNNLNNFFLMTELDIYLKYYQYKFSKIILNTMLIEACKNNSNKK